MILKSIKLTNFRNYHSLNFKFKREITVLVGDNAQGKSNFLESIYFLSTSKSPKADKDEELVRKGEEVGRVEGEIADVESGNLKLEVVMQLILEQGLSKRVKVNGIARRVLDYSGYLAVVLFSPEDINLIIGSPSDRRYHLDQIISQSDKHYKKTLSSYEDVVSRKNKVLKSIREGVGGVDELSFWMDQQILLGTLLQEKRRSFFEFINNVKKTFGDYKFEYLENPINKDRLIDYQGKEIDAAASLIGPHRDDFVFLLNAGNLASFGSRGEQRTAVLDLKLAEVSYLENTLGHRPLLLLDDIFSELDHPHSEHVLEIAKLQQTIVTAVELDSHLKEKFKDAEITTVSSGKIARD